MVFCGSTKTGDFLMRNQKRRCWMLLKKGLMNLYNSPNKKSGMNILGSFNLCATKRIMLLYFKVALFLTFLCAGQLSAQTDTIIQNFDIPKDDSENLNVLRQWIKWNNPGSLLVQHLSSQASNYY